MLLHFIFSYFMENWKNIILGICMQISWENWCCCWQKEIQY